jgi:hypothetical protein
MIHTLNIYIALCKCIWQSLTLPMCKCKYIYLHDKWCKYKWSILICTTLVWTCTYTHETILSKKVSKEIWLALIGQPHQTCGI